MQEGRAEEGKRRLVGRRYQTSGGVVWLVDEGNGEKGSQVASAKVPGAKSTALHDRVDNDNNSAFFALFYLAVNSC